MKERLVYLRNHFKLTQNAFSKKVGIAQSSMNRIETNSSISYPNAVKISTETGCSLDWLLTGNGEAFPANDKIGGGSNDEVSQISLWDGFTPVPIIGVAGLGDHPFEPDIPEDQVEYIPIPKGIKVPKGSIAVKVQGKSMEPQLYSGDLLIVSEIDPASTIDGMDYLVVCNEGALVKTVHHVEGGWELKSYNYPTITTEQVFRCFQIIFQFGRYRVPWQREPEIVHKNLHE